MSWKSLFQTCGESRRRKMFEEHEHGSGGDDGMGNLVSLRPRGTKSDTCIRDLRTRTCVTRLGSSDSGSWPQQRVKNKKHIILIPHVSPST